MSDLIDHINLNSPNRQEKIKHLEKIEKVRQKMYREYANQMTAGLDKVPDIQRLFSLPAEGQRWLTGKAREAMDLHTDDPSSIAFRYHTVPFFREMATWEHLFKQESFNNPSDLLSSGGMGRLALRVAHKYNQEANNSLPWAIKNPDKVEQYVMATPGIDPLWLQDFYAYGLKTAIAAPKVAQLTPFAEKIMQAASHKDVIIATKDLWGADSVAPSFYKAVKEIQKAGASSTELAKYLYTQGFRTTQGVNDIEIPFSQYFKRGSNLYSPRYQEFAEMATQIREAISKNFELAYSRVKPVLSQAENYLAQWAMHNVEREAADPIGSFTQNYQKMVAQGTAPRVSEKVFERLKAVISELGSGWREKGEWRSQYGPAKSTVKQIEEGLAIEANSGKPGRGYELKREGGPGFFKTVEDTRKWVAGVATRVQRDNLIDSLITAGNTRRKSLLEAAVKLRKSGDLGGAKQLWEESRFTKHIITDAKSFRQTTDLLKKVKKAEPFPILKALDTFLNWTRTADLTNTAFIVHRYLDHSIIKSLVETGAIDTNGLKAAILGAESQPSRGVNGQLLNFGGPPLDYLYGERGVGQGFFGKVSGAIRTRIEAIDKSFFNYVGRYHYNEGVSKAVDSGLSSAESIHHHALKYAEKIVDQWHGMYRHKAPVDDLTRRIWEFPTHYQQQLKGWGVKMLENPLESEWALRLRKMQQEHSVDRLGSYRVTGTKWALDPFNRTTIGRLVDILNNTNEYLTPQQNVDYRPMRLVHAIMGPPTPVTNLLIQKMGGAPDSGEKDFGQLDKVMNVLTKTATDEDIAPSDAFWHLLGKHPEESRQDYEDRKANMFRIAAKREGQEISPDQARGMAREASNVATMASFFLGKRVVPSSPGFDSMTQDLNEARGHLINADPEFAEGIRHSFKADGSKYQDLDSIIPQAPITRLKAKEHILDDEKALTEGALRNLPTEPTEEQKAQHEEMQKTERGNNIIDALKNSKYAAPFHMIYDALVPPAGAAETHQDNPLLDSNVSWDSNGNTILVPKDQTSTANQQSSARSQKALGPDKKDMSELPSFTAIKNYMDNPRFHDADGKNWMVDYVRSGAKSDQFLSQMINAYDYISSGGKQGQANLTTRMVGTNRSAFAQDYYATLENNELSARDLNKLPLSSIRDMVSSGRIKTSVPLEAIDKPALDFARSRVHENQLYAIERKYQSDQDQQYPDNAYFKKTLNSVVYHQADQTHQLVDQINDGIKNGSVAPRFWEDMQKTNQRLYEDASITDRYKELQAVKTSLYAYGPDGKPHLDPSLVASQLLNGHGAIVGALRKIEGKQFNDQLQQITDRMGIDLDGTAPADPVLLGHTFGQDFDYRVGIKDVSTELFHRYMGQDTDPELQTVLHMNPASPMASNTQPEKVIPDQRPTPLQPTQDFPIQKNESSILVEKIPNIDIKPVNTAIITRNYRPYQNVGQYVADVWSSWSAQSTMAKEAGIAQPSLAAIAASKAVYDTGQTNPETQEPITASSLPVYQTARGISALAQISSSLAGTNPSSDAGRALGGFQTAISTFGALSSLGVPAPVSAPLAIFAGVYQGVKSGKSKDTGAQFAAQQRFQLEKERFHEQIRQQDIRSYRQREIDLTKAYNSNGPTYQNRVNEILAGARQQLSFQRRGTFASRMGLVNQVESQLGSALKPRW